MTDFNEAIDTIIESSKGWWDIVNQNVAIDDRTQHGRTVFQLPATLEDADRQGRKGTAYQITLGRSQDNTAGIISETYGIDLHHEREGFMITEGGRPIQGVNLEVSEMHFPSGTAHQFIRFHFAMKNPTGEISEFSFAADIENGQCIPDKTSFLGDSNLFSVEVIQDAMKSMDKALKFSVPRTLQLGEGKIVESEAAPLDPFQIGDRKAVERFNTEQAGKNKPPQR